MKDSKENGLIDIVGRENIYQSERPLNIKEKYDHLLYLSKNPYHGKSPYLFDQIMFIGYEKKSIKKIIKAKLLSQLKKQDTKRLLNHSNTITSSFLNTPQTLDNKYKLSIKPKPIILSTICSTADQIMIDNDLLIDCIFPNDPIIYSQKQFMQEPKLSQGLSIIFSFNVSINYQETSRYYYYSYVYYEKTIIDLNTYYYPKGICFTSNYPYFLNYLNLAEFIKIMNVPFPIEYYLYQLIYLPSPINSNFIFDYFYATQTEHNSSAYFKKLSGYPLLQLNCAAIFKFLPINTLIKIFIFTFLEIDVLLFSNNQEVLNAIMHILSEFNYPFNNSTYFNHIASISLEAFLKGTSPIMLKPFSGMLGINATYNSELGYLNTISISECAVVDLDRKVCLFNSSNSLQKQKNDNLNLSHLFNAIDKIIEEPKNFIDKSIFELSQDLNYIYLKTAKEIEQNIELNFNYFFPSNAKKQDHENISRLIQEYFYNFTLKILTHFSSVSKDVLSKDKIITNSLQKSLTNHLQNMRSRVISYTKVNLTKQKHNDFNSKFIENIFCNSFIQSSKYSLYFEDFLHNFKSNNLNKIQLIFAEEFIHSQINGNFISSMFDAIDLYYKIPCKEWPKVNMKSYYDLAKKEVGFSKQSNILELLDFKLKSSKVNKNRVISSKEYIKYQQYISISNKESIAQDISVSEGIIINQKNIDLFSSIYKAVFDSVIEQKKISINELLISSYILFIGLSKYLILCDFNNKDEIALIIFIIRITSLINQRRIILDLMEIFISIIKQKIAEPKEKNQNEITYITELIALIITQDITPTQELCLLIYDSFMDEFVIDNDIQNKKLLDLKNDFVPAFLKTPSSITTSFTPYLQFKNQKINSKKEYDILLLTLSNNYKNDGFFQDITEELLTTISLEGSTYQRWNAQNYHWVTWSDKKILINPIYLPRSLFEQIWYLSKHFISDSKNFKPNKVILQDLCSSLLFYIINIGNLFDSSSKNLFPKELYDQLTNKMIEHLYLILLKL